MSNPMPRTVSARNNRTALVESLENRTVFNGTLATALNLGTLFGQAVHTDSVSASAPVDYYKVTLASTGKLLARVTNLTANADLKIIKDANGNGKVDAGEVKAASSHAGTAAEQAIAAPLGPGAYFVAVNRVTGSPSYKLTVKTDYAGQDFPTARNLGTFSGTKILKDRVDGDDHDDFYKIVLTSPKTITASLTGNGDADLELSVDTDNDGHYTIGQDFIQRSNQPGTSNESTGSFPLAAGTYFIRVFRGTADADYTVNINVS